MKITQEKKNGKSVVSLDGRFDFGTRKAFKETVEQVAEDKSPVILDLEHVSFVDSSALGLLVICHQNLKKKQIPLYLVHPQPYVKQVLDLANIGKMIPIYETVAEVQNQASVPAGVPA
jgi:anti-anti-sigma factor